VKITIRDIARMTNLSTATVSRVLNNKPDVSEQAREKVMEVIQQHNYNPNSVARGLALNRTNTIGLILPDITNPFFPELARGVESRAKDLGYSVILTDIKNDNAALIETVDFLRTKQVDGIIIVQWSNSFSKELEQTVNESDLPIVAIDREEGKSYVNFDNFSSGYQAAKFLIDQGHVDIGHITGDMATLAAQKRYEGFRNCLVEHGIPFNEEWIYQGDFTLESGYKGMATLLGKERKPSAVFAANDMLAIGAYDAVNDAGLSIPEDISIIGHDDISFASIVRPKLTTISVPRYELGMSCVDALHLLMGKKQKEPQVCNHGGTLSIRDSVRIRI